ncbi:MAG TPA: ABC transporter [Lachnoclostridium phytofermentans]|uniref:ABC transporter n=1 Tax=Lachnoclostridium phytofermentans TaxID=66219 RepID=A0A3D2X399_9FIRM|nr:ABC transporter ATP-binding protein [Lachnoclostridium sp.]HCL01620.1 ABC transporter [Lachnoclostridium phytofermentans]
MLEVNHVHKAYQNHTAVEDISFQMKQGEITGLIGPNGAGKSTTVSMIATLLRPDKGQILFNGEDISKNPKIIRSSLGYVPQDIALYESLTGMDNFEFWGNAYHLSKTLRKERIKQLSDMIGFTESELNRKVKEYSGGMKRRLNIAVALLHEPKLVILDEPTVGIDLQSRKQILSAIEQLKKSGTAILYVGHYLEEVERLCDRILIFNQGRCVWNDTVSNSLIRSDQKISLEQLYEELSIN